MPFKEVLYDLSYQNLILYGAVIPSFDSSDKKESGDGKSGNNEEILWVDDPNNRQRAIEMIQKMV